MSDLPEREKVKTLAPNISGPRPIGKYLALALFSFCLGLLLFLGTWQLNLGLEKQRLENDLSAQSDQYTRLSSRPATWNKLQHQLVRLKGQWQPSVGFLMANRVYRSQVGYEAYNPFILGDDTIILVNRGWVAMNVDAQSLLVERNEETWIQGHLYLPESGFTLGKSVEESTLWPRVMQYFDKDQLSDALGQEIDEVVMVLDSEHPLAEVRIWKPLAMKSERHFGYAFQWWGLALTLIIFGFIWKKQNFFRSR